jgi:hypothetical protein
MTVPNEMDLSVPVPEPVQTAAKAVAATLTSAAGVVALFLTAVGDGSVSWAEGGTLLTAVLTGVATVSAVWAKSNKPK